MNNKIYNGCFGLVGGVFGLYKPSMIDIMDGVKKRDGLRAFAIYSVRIEVSLCY